MMEMEGTRKGECIESKMKIQCVVCRKPVGFKLLMRLTDSNAAYHCRECGVIRIMGDRKGNENGIKLDLEGRKMSEKQFYWYADDNYQFLKKNVASGGKSFLDIGCSIGTAVDYYAKKGWIAKGVDVDRQAVEYGNHLGRNLSAGGIETVEGEFDLIHINHVIEHLRKPGEFLASCRKHLSSRSRIFIVTPTYRSFRGWIYGKKWNGFCPGEHEWIYSKRSMKILLNNYNYEVIKICQRQHRGWPHPDWWKKGFWWKRLGLIGIMRLSGIIGAGDGLYVIARKKQEKE